jgi:hypothetical protein
LWSDVYFGELRISTEPIFLHFLQDVASDSPYTTAPIIFLAAWNMRGLAFEKLGYYYDAFVSYSKAESLGNPEGTQRNKGIKQHRIDSSEAAVKIPVFSVNKNPYDNIRPYYYDLKKRISTNRNHSI